MLAEAKSVSYEKWLFRTEKDIDEWNCAIAWLPMLNINTANESRKTCEATESFRNEMVKQNDIAKIITEKMKELNTGE